MAWHSQLFRRIPLSLAAQCAAGFWLSLLLSFAHITEVRAWTGFGAIDESISASRANSGSFLLPVGHCTHGGRGCSEHDTATYYEQPAYDTYTVPPRSHHETEETVIVEECDEGYTLDPAYENPPAPEPYYYETEHSYLCGVRCWYKRLTSGYCGRGCEYYRFRTGWKRKGCRASH